MKIKSSTFVCSSAHHTQCPDSPLPEFAFIGRSNVGKSSLINMLTGRKSLAMTSSTPGKTLLINHFLVNDSWYLVDLPGYGYAQRGKETLRKLAAMNEGYLLQRMQMACLFLLIDSRIPPQAIDLKFTEFLGENQIPFALVFTKTDKQSASKTNQHVQAFLHRMSAQWEELPPHFLTSSITGQGREQLLDFIDGIRQSDATQA